MSAPAPNNPNGDIPMNSNGDDTNDTNDANDANEDDGPINPNGDRRYEWQANGGMRSLSREQGLRLLRALQDTGERARDEYETIQNLRRPYEQHFTGIFPQLRALVMREEVLKSLATKAEREYHQCQWDAMFGGRMSVETLRQIQAHLNDLFQPFVEAAARVDAESAEDVRIDLNGVFERLIQRAAARDAALQEAREEALRIVRHEYEEEIEQEAVRHEAAAPAREEPVLSAREEEEEEEIEEEPGQAQK